MATTSDVVQSPLYSEHTPTSEANGSLDVSKHDDSTSPSGDCNNIEHSHADKPNQNNQEHSAGITVFVSSNVPGFTCTIKQRYTDFLVNEILPDGQVLHLTSLAAPSKGQKRKNDKVSDGVTNGASDAVSASETTESKREEPMHKGMPEDEPLPDDASTPRKKRRVEDTEVAGNDTSLEGSATVASASQETPASTLKKDRNEEIIAGVLESDKIVLLDIFGEVTTKRILNLYANVMLHPGRKPRDQATVMSEPIAEKSKRTEAHVAIRNIFASKLETLTMQDQLGVMSIKAAPTKGPSGARGQSNRDGADGAYQKGKLGWSELGGEYLHFTLYKENKDTMEVLYYIASQLKVQIKNFQFAGTKDRRGVTAQRVAIFRVRGDRIAHLNRSARGWRAGDFEYKKHGLDLGELNGNEFLLTLRDCQFQGEEGLEREQRLLLANEVVAKTTESLRENGFLNYYGLQRFGTFSTGTHMVGQKMLKGDLEGAIDSILTYSDDMLPENQDASASKKVPQDDINRADAIRIWRSTGKMNDAVSKMPKRFQAEAAIIQYLGKRDRKSGKLIQERDWQGALMQIQRNLRLMYVHAYQSFVWNTVVGKRWELYGDGVVEGDLVIVGEKDVDAGIAKAEVDEDGEPIFHPAADDSAPSAEDSFTRARHLTKEEAEGGTYDIFDIVLPLPGFDVSYPANVVGKYYEEFMASDAGGNMDPHDMRRAWKDISLSGGYRKMMARPGKQFDFEVKTYTTEAEQMVETDLEKLQKGRGAKSVDSVTEKDGVVDSEQDKRDADCKIAVVFKMQLGSSQYATMALRELTKGGAVNYKPDYSAR